jgi:hypothetical protein
VRPPLTVAIQRLPERSGWSPHTTLLRSSGVLRVSKTVKRAPLKRASPAWVAIQR